MYQIVRNLFGLRQVVEVDLTKDQAQAKVDRWNRQDALHKLYSIEPQKGSFKDQKKAGKS